MKFSTLLFVCLAGATLAAGEPSNRIAGGLEAMRGQFPWLVTVELTNTETTWHLCDGVLIAPQWVLTAAHCLDSEKPEWLTVISGEHYKNVNEGTEQYHLVDYFVKHPQYIYFEKPYVNDVGLLHLQHPAIIDKFTQVALLRSSSSPLSGWCEEPGWGEKVSGGGMSDSLQYTWVSIQPSTICETAYSSPHDPNAVCAGDVNGGIGFCTGDNGGGLMCFDEEAQTNVVSGILSWRDGCAKPGNPGVYMDVSPYVEWIFSEISSFT